MAEVQWIKLSTGTFDTSRKIKQIEKMTDGDTILIIWFKLLCLAGAINDGGAIYITPEVAYDYEGLADELRRDVDIVQKALETFEKFGMIHRDDVGFICLSSWEKYQNVDRLAEIREQNRLRKQKQRAMSRNSHVTVTEDVTPCHAVEEEREEDKEEDKEFHSFVLSREEIDIIDKRIKEQGFEGEDAIAYGKKVAKELRLTTLHGTLGQGKLMMSDEQFNDLLSRLSWEEFHKYIGIVVDCENKGKRYKKKTHYQAILDMARKDRKIL